MKISKSIDSVTLHKFGTPLTTGAFQNSLDGFHWEESSDFEYRMEETALGVRISLALEDEAPIVGLGQHVGPVNCKGQVFRLFSTDNYLHIPSLRSMYGTYPLLFILAKNPYAIFIDSPADIKVDAGSTDRSLLSLKVFSKDFYFAKIEGESLSKLFSKYLELTGTPFIPPRWAFGYQQSRWSYKDESEVRELVANFSEHEIPLDVVHLDIHYMDNYKVFTVDKQRFPDLPALSEELKSKGIRLVTIIDPGVKVEAGYDIYEEGISKGYFCKKTDSKEEFVGAVWPGPSVFPDFFRKEVRDWWGQKYEKLIDLGISAFWNDMNEPAMFYTPQAFEKYSDLLHKHRTEKNYNEDLANLIFNSELQNNEAYNDQFLHELEGKTLKHRSVRNLYGTMMTNSLADYFERKTPEKRQFVLSRSSYPGMHRRAAIWTGDNHSWWEHLPLNIQMLISLNLSGMLFTGADVGGFSGDCNGELLVRWNQLGLFMPFYRNHSASWAVRQEPWSFDNEALKLTRSSIRLRYRLLPYLYSEFIQAAFNFRPFITGMFFDYPDAIDRVNENQFLCGRALLIAPIVEASAKARNVWLPNGPWLKVKVSENGLSGEKILNGGDHRIQADLSETPVFMKLNSAVCMTNDAESNSLNTDFPKHSKFKILSFLETEAECVILLDDGETKYPDWISYPKVYLRLSRKDSKISISTEIESSDRKDLSFDVEAWTRDGKMERISAS